MENIFGRVETAATVLMTGLTKSVVKEVKVNEKDSKDQFRVDIVFEKGKHSIWLKNEEKANKDKTKFIFRDNKGNTTIFVAEAIDSTNQNFDSAKAVKCKIGEDELIKFFKAFLNRSKEQNETTDFPEFDYSELEKGVLNVKVNGKVYPIQEVLNQLKTNEVVYVLGVKDGKYNDVFDKFDVGYKLSAKYAAKTQEAFKKAIDKYNNDSYVKTKSFFTSDLLRPFNAQTDVVTTNISTSNNAVDIPSTPTNVDEDDLPF
jgi:hypothetical protein